MKIQDTYSCNANRETVWESLLNPELLQTCIPGCQKLSKLADYQYDFKISVHMGAITGIYSGTIMVDEMLALDSFRMIVECTGSTGSVKGTAILRFIDEGETTYVEVDGDAHISGIVARVGQRLLGGASNMLMNRFFECMNSKMEN